MSPIEKLKAEATALRAAEKVRGLVIKHCDALEHVAKKHGYANWRACVAILGRDDSAGTSTPSAPGPAASGVSNVVVSALAGGEFASARESAFTRWLSPALKQATVDFSRNVGLVPIYSETSAQGTRYLLWQLPVGAKCEVRSGRTSAEFLAFDSVGRAQGRRLLSLHTDPTGLHSAVWISAEHHATAVQYLGRFGISPAEVRGTP